MQLKCRRSKRKFNLSETDISYEKVSLLKTDDNIKKRDITD